MLKMSIDGEKILISGLKRLQDRGDRADLMDSIGAYGVISTEQRFLDQEDPEGNAWQKSGRARAEGGQTLRDTGRLFQSLTHEADQDTAAWGSNVIYAGIHHFGGEIRPKNAQRLAFQTASGFVTTSKVTMPARPYLGLNDTDRAEVGRIVNDWLGEVMR